MIKVGNDWTLEELLSHARREGLIEGSSRTEKGIEIRSGGMQFVLAENKAKEHLQKVLNARIGKEAGVSPSSEAAARLRAVRTTDTIDLRPESLDYYSFDELWQLSRRYGLVGGIRRIEGGLEMEVERKLVRLNLLASMEFLRRVLIAWIKGHEAAKFED